MGFHGRGREDRVLLTPSPPVGGEGRGEEGAATYTRCTSSPSPSSQWRRGICEVRGGAHPLSPPGPAP
jgi:hypothetical protein